MISVSQYFKEQMVAPQRYIKGYVGLNGSTTLTDDLVSFKISRTPANIEFWGYSICQELNIECFNNHTNHQWFKPYVGITNEYIPQNTFYPDDVKYDEKTNRTRIKAYDAMKAFEYHTMDELDYSSTKTIKSLIQSAANKVGLTVTWDDTSHIENTSVPGFNFEGKETFRDLFNEAAKITGTICYINNNNSIVFKQPVIKYSPDLQIDKNVYFEQQSGESYTLTGVTLATELGDNLTVGTDTGYVQVIRDSAITELMEDSQRTTVLTALYNQMNGLTMTGYTLNWRGNPALEIGDTVQLQKKNNTYYSVLYLGEDLSFTGGLNSNSKWESSENSNPDSNPVNIVDAIYTTRAKVDKINHTIELRVEEAIGKSQTIADLVISVGQIQSTVAQVEDDVVVLQTQMTQLPDQIRLIAEETIEESETISSLVVSVGQIESTVTTMEGDIDSLEGDVTTIQSRITQLPGEITLQVEEDIKDDYYGKVSTVDITTDGIGISSTGSITLASGSDLILNSGAGFEVHSANFTIDSSGNVSLKGSIQSQSTLSGVTVSGGTISGGTINIGSGKFKVNSDGSVSACGGNFNIYDDIHGGESVASCNGGFVVNGVMQSDAINVYGEHNWAIDTDGTCYGLKAIAVFGA